MFGISSSIVYRVFPQFPFGQVTRKLKEWSFFGRKWSFLNCVTFSILYVLREYIWSRGYVLRLVSRIYSFYVVFLMCRDGDFKFHDALFHVL